MSPYSVGTQKALHGYFIHPTYFAVLADNYAVLIHAFLTVTRLAYFPNPLLRINTNFWSLSVCMLYRLSIHHPLVFSLARGACREACLLLLGSRDERSKEALNKGKIRFSLPKYPISTLKA